MSTTPIAPPAPPSLPEIKKKKKKGRRSSRVCPHCDAPIPKKHRTPNPYNLFVREKMQDPRIKAKPSKERMQAISKLWKFEGVLFRKSLPPASSASPTPTPVSVNCGQCGKLLKVAKPKSTRKLSAYTIFFTENVKKEQFKHLTPKARMKAIGALWTAHKLAKKRDEAAAAAVESKVHEVPSSVALPSAALSKASASLSGSADPVSLAVSTEEEKKKQTKKLARELKKKQAAWKASLLPNLAREKKSVKRKKSQKMTRKQEKNQAAAANQGQVFQGAV